ncbi:MAG: diguanylate cyclase (GGDEF)-like protein [Paraglaciecola sp.]|jgi:diguanylate cyclase (GGDEF)-like protein
MENNKHSSELSLEELRELIPQLQQLTVKYKHSEAIQKSLFDISELASSVNELTELYPSIHNIIARFMNAQNFYVAFYEKENAIIDFVYFVDQFEELEQSRESADKIKNSLTSYILLSGNHLFLTQENFHQQVKSLSVNYIGPLPVDWIGVPLKRGNQVIGAMVIQSYDKAIRYTQEDLDILLFVSQHIVNAVDRVKSRELNEQIIRERTQQLQNINEVLQAEINERQKVESLQQALFEISELSASVDGEMADFYASLHKVLARLISAPNCYIATLNADKQHLEFPYYFDELSTQGHSREISLGLTEFVLRSGNAELINPSRVQNLMALGEIDPRTAQLMIENNTSWLGSPLVVDGEISGVIAVQSYREGEHYSLQDLELLRFVSHHIAVALERKSSSEAIQLYNQQLTEKVKERTKELHKTNLSLQKQVKEREAIQQKLVHDANHDALTQLPNRAMFTNRLELALASKQRHLHNNFAVAFIDLDRFKQINDTIGHHAGDAFLVEVARRITECIRGHDLLARLGGDEFVILLDNFEKPADVEVIATRIINSTAAPFVIEGREVFSGASIGIAYIESGYQSASEIVRDADSAMYQAKAKGRGQYIAFHKSMRKKSLEELDIEIEIENQFRKTLKSESFSVFSQPVFDMHTTQHLYDECMVCWDHPKLGLMERERFWQIAEHSGLVAEMDIFMLKAACAMLQRRQGGASSSKDYKVSVNLSIHYLTQIERTVQLITYVKNAGIDPKRLIFKFDENDLNRRSEYSLPAIKHLKHTGIKLLLDNFGSGLASLSYLYSYPFDFVKVDRKLVKNVLKSQRNLKLIQSVLAISHHLNFKLIAAGIANKEQYKLLSSVGCQYGQGDYLQEANAIEL